jgi:hypothetical protein
MRVLGCLLICVFLLNAASSAAPACSVNVVFQHAPKTTRDFERVLAKAEAGDRAAQFQAGLALETGAGTEQDYAEAVKWYRKAANQGNAAEDEEIHPDRVAEVSRGHIHQAHWW